MTGFVLFGPYNRVRGRERGRFRSEKDGRRSDPPPSPAAEDQTEIAQMTSISGSTNQGLIHDTIGPSSIHARLTQIPFIHP
jgi:hypothetical protein